MKKLEKGHIPNNKAFKVENHKIRKLYPNILMFIINKTLKISLLKESSQIGKTIQQCAIEKRQKNKQTNEKKNTQKRANLKIKREIQPKKVFLQNCTLQQH